MLASRRCPVGRLWAKTKKDLCWVAASGFGSKFDIGVEMDELQMVRWFG
jgi:hypothetical protein